MKKSISIFVLLFTTVFFAIYITSTSVAQPYSKGIYNVNLPYGDQTSLSIATNGNVDVPITPTLSGVLATGISTVTVTSTDVKGYMLYIRALNSTSMNNLGSLLPTSANGSPASLAIDTWGYNTDASTNFVGMTLSDVLIHSISVPAPTGDITNITYGIKMDMAKPAGKYVASVVYTAVPQTD